MCHTSHDMIFILYVRRNFPDTHLALNELINVGFPVSKSMSGYFHQCSLICACPERKVRQHYMTYIMWKLNVEFTYCIEGACIHFKIIQCLSILLDVSENCLNSYKILLYHGKP